MTSTRGGGSPWPPPGFERGVSLRSPARFSAAADRLVELWRTDADPADTGLRDAVVDAWMQAEGYKLHTYMTVTHMIDGGTIGAEASLNKIFWSEMDVRIHELALQIIGPEAERMSGPLERWVDGFLFSLSVPIYAGTNEIQRNIIADRVLSSRGCVMKFRVHRRPAAVRRRAARPPCQGVHARDRPRRVGRRHRARARLWDHLAEMGVFAMLVPEADGGMGGSEVDLVLLLQELGRAAVPGPVLETAAVVAPAAR